MWTIIIGAIVNLLIFFFERWWTNSYPYDPAQYRANFMDEVNSLRHFWMGPDRAKYAGLLFDKFEANYKAAPPVISDQDGLLNQAYASFHAKKYARGLTLTYQEVYGKAQGRG